MRAEPQRNSGFAHNGRHVRPSTFSDERDLREGLVARGHPLAETRQGRDMTRETACVLALAAGSNPEDHTVRSRFNSDPRASITVAQKQRGDLDDTERSKETGSRV